MLDVYQLGSRRTDAKTGANMVYVPHGSFMMGSMYLSDDEKPAHEQVIPHSFWIDLTPVTNAAYAMFMADGGYHKRQFWTAAGWQWREQESVIAPEDYTGFAAPDQPRVGIAWYEARAFAAWRGCRLLTESEWEWAACGPDTYLYAWGNAFPVTFPSSLDYVIYAGNSGGKSHSVGEGIRTKGAAWCAALDMSGNVWEWVNSLYRPYPYAADDGREASEGMGFRVLRGGSWLSYTTYIARRDTLNPHIRTDYSGFRVAASVAVG